MNKSTRIDSKQLAILVGASLLTDSFIQPFGRVDTIHSAQFGIVCAAAQALLFAALFCFLRRRSPAIFQHKITTGLLALGLLISIALEIIQGERFYNYVIQSKLSIGIFLGIVFVAAFYGVYSGLDALSRTAAIILSLTVFSVLMLSVSILPQLHFTNLQPVFWRISTVTNAVLSQIYLPPELFFWTLLLTQEPREQNTHLQTVLICLVSASTIFSLLGEMTLGEVYQEQEQPLFTIARLGGISVFRRLDALHVSVWLLLFLLKVTFYFSMLVLTVKKLFPLLKNRSPYYVSVAAVLCVFLVAWGQAENTAYFIQQGLLVILLIFVSIIPKQRRKSNEAN